MCVAYFCSAYRSYLSFATLDRLTYPNSTYLPYPREPLTFKTFPDQRLGGGSHFKFIASSGIVSRALCDSEPILTFLFV
jgi:hypothetical protein